MIDAHPQSDERSVIQQRYFSGTDEPVSFTVLGKLNGFRRQTMQQREGRIMKSLRERAKKAVEDAILADIPCAPYRSSGGIP
jgi:DNA-directed RNA polymerase sigma subunit (sigma70/sigma32)